MTSTEREIIVIGSGGHAKVVIATAQAAGFRVHSVYDDDESRHGGNVLGVPIAGSIASVTEAGGRSAINAIGSNRARADVCAGLDFVWATLVHPSAVVHSSTSLGEGTVVFAGVVVQPGTKVGKHVILNTCSSVDHDCKIDDYAHIAPGARLCGNVTIAQGALMGVCSSALPGVGVGAWAVVGGGATVVDSIPPGVVAIGTPARVV